MTTVIGETYPLRVLVCGGRDYTDGARVNEVLSGLRIEEMCHGNAKGADRLAAWWAASTKTRCRAYPADWSRHGKAAGPLRNKFMLEDFDPELVVAFPGGVGTADMVRRAAAAGVEVLAVDAPVGVIESRKEK